MFSSSYLKMPVIKLVKKISLLGSNSLKMLALLDMNSEKV